MSRTLDIVLPVILQIVHHPVVSFSGDRGSRTPDLIISSESNTPFLIPWFPERLSLIIRLGKLNKCRDEHPDKEDETETEAAAWGGDSTPPIASSDFVEDLIEREGDATQIYKAIIVARHSQRIISEDDPLNWAYTEI